MKKISAVMLSGLFSLCFGISVSASTFAATGNTEKSTYIIVLVVAGLLIAAAIVAGIFTKKKK